MRSTFPELHCQAQKNIGRSLDDWRNRVVGIVDFELHWMAANREEDLTDTKWRTLRDKIIRAIEKDILDKLEEEAQAPFPASDAFYSKVLERVYDVVKFRRDRIGDYLQKEFTGPTHLMLTADSNLSGKAAQAFKAVIAWVAAAELFKALDHRGMARKLYEDWWNTNSFVQLNRGKHVYRARAAFDLAQMMFEDGYRAEAFRWFALALIDDLLNEADPEATKPRISRKTNSPDYFGSQYWLRTHFGWSASMILGLCREIESKNSNTRSEAGIWRRREGFPEYHFASFVCRLPERQYVGAQEFLSPTASLNPTFLRVFLRDLRVGKKVDGERALGTEFEILCSYLFSLINGLVIQRDILGEDQAFQSDILVRNFWPRNAAVDVLGGKEILVECKWRNEPRSAHEIGHHIARMLALGIDRGMVISKSDLKGALKNEGKGAKAAEALAKRFRPAIRLAKIVFFPNMKKNGGELEAHWRSKLLAELLPGGWSTKSLCEPTTEDLDRDADVDFLNAFLRAFRITMN